MGRDDRTFLLGGLLLFTGALLAAAVWWPLIGVSLLGFLTAYLAAR